MTNIPVNNVPFKPQLTGVTDVKPAPAAKKAVVDSGASAESAEFVEFVCNTFGELAGLFQAKNKQYGTKDPLANFRTAAYMNQHDGGYPAMYKEAKEFCAKHIAQVINNDIEGEKVDESLKDIAVYSVIMLYMRKKWSEE